MFRVTHAEETFAPRAILEVEVSDHSVRWKGSIDTLQRDEALVLVRLHTRPLGVVDVVLGGRSLDHAAGDASEKFAALVAEHLREDEEQRSRRGVEGGHDNRPSCLADRVSLLAKAPRASVVLATKDRPELAKRCLESIQQLDYPNFEVIVVDSSAGNDTESLVKVQPREVIYVRNSYGRVCVAKTRGAKEATGMYVAFTDDDAEVDRHWLTELVLALHSSPEVACATGLVLPLELDTQAQLWFEESGAFVEGIRPRRISLASRERGSLLPYATGRIGAGVNMAWRTDVLEQLGYFDIALDRCGAEDLAAFFDALCAGHEIAYAPGAIVWHQHRRTVEDLRRQTLWHATGLGAYLTRCVVKEPARVGDLVTRIPNGLRYGFAARSIRNNKKSRSFPKEVTRQEWIGFLKGPGAYVRGVLAAHRLHRAESTRKI